MAKKIVPSIATPKTGGRLRRQEQDAPADSKGRDFHRGMCQGALGGTLHRFREFLIEQQGPAGTRIHRDDARQMNYLLKDFETEMLELIKDARIQKHGVRDPSGANPVVDGPSNVVSFRTREELNRGVPEVTA